MDLMTLLSGIPIAGPIIPYVAALVALCAALAPVLKPSAPGATGVYPGLYAAVNFIALNVGHAKNAG